MNAALPARERALVELAADLSAHPPGLKTQTLAALPTAGLDEAQALDAVYAATLFAWAHRLMLTLGEALRPAA